MFEVLKTNLELKSQADITAVNYEKKEKKKWQTIKWKFLIKLKKKNGWQSKKHWKERTKLITRQNYRSTSSGEI